MPKQQHTVGPEKHEAKEAGDLTEATDTLKRLERQGGGSVKVEHTEDVDTKKHIDTEERYAERLHTGHVSSLLFVCVMFVIAVGAILFMSPMILLVNNKEQISNDLNDGLYAYYTYTNKVLGGQLGTGCDEETIQCKFKTMSPMLKERFERYGFKLIASEAKNKRYKVTSLIAPNGGGAAVDATTLNMARKNQSTDTLVNKVYSSRTSVYQDKQFYQMLLSRYGLNQANPLNADTRKDFDKEFDDRVTYGDSPRYINDEVDPEKAADQGGVTNESDEDAIDANGRGVYSLGSLAEMTNEWRTDIYTNLVDKANTHLALACAYATYGNLAENALMRAKMVSITRFAMNYLAVADDVKSGSMDNGGEIPVEALSDKLTKRDSKGKNAMDGDSYRVPALGESLKDRGKFITQLSPLLQLAMIKVGAVSVPGTDYLKAALTSNVVQNSARDRTASGLCGEGMAGAQLGTEQGGLCYTPASYPLAQYIGVVAGGIVGAAKDPIERILCPTAFKSVLEIVKNATRAEVTTTLPQRLEIAAQQEAKNFTSSLTGIEAQNVIFAGAGQILGDRAQSLGMRPASADSLAIYLKMAQTVRQQQENEQRQLARATPWDATNPYSFTGSVIAKFMPAGATLPTESWRSSAATLLSSVPLSFATLTESGASALYTQPLHFQLSRLQPATACGILGGFDRDIMPDFACNVRYSMNPEELSLGINEILDYMTKAHPDNAKESLAQVEARDIGADSERGAKMKQQAKDGAGAAYIDKKTGKPNKYTEYAKFLEYCTNRYDPWGQVGMSVELKDPSKEKEEEEKKAAEEGEKNTAPSGWGSVLPTNYEPGRSEGNGNTLLEPREVEDSYYALGWGSKKDQDWYTGKQCTKDSEMMKYFRGYTMACALLASMSGTTNCWEDSKIANGHDDFYLTNNIIFKSANPAF